MQMNTNSIINMQYVAEKYDVLCQKQQFGE